MVPLVVVQKSNLYFRARSIAWAPLDNSPQQSALESFPVAKRTIGKTELTHDVALGRGSE